MAKGKTLDLTIRIAGQMDKSLSGAISSVKGQMSSLSTTLSNIGTVGLAAMGGLAAGTVAALSNCADAASDFKNQMADVVKYVGGLADEAGQISGKTFEGNGQTYEQNYDEMSKAILDLSTQIPLTVEELTQLAAAAGQSGKSIGDLIQRDEEGNISGFLKDVAMMSTAMDIAADQAGDWAAKWEQAFGMNHAEVMALADQINYLGANNATTAAEIAQVVNDSASLGQIAGESPATTAAFATAMLATGVDEARTATSISKIYSNMSLGSSATDAQQAMWESMGFTAEGIAKSMQVDSTGTLLNVFRSIKELDADKQVAALKVLFGQWAIQGAAKITNNIPLYENALAAVADPTKYNGSMEREFVIKSETPEALDTRVASAVNAFKVEMGTQLLPAKKEISLAGIDFMNSLRSMPEVSVLAESVGKLAGSGINKLADVLESALPHIQKALDYLINNGPQVMKALGGLTAAFVGMRFAPLAEGAVRGVGSLLFGSGTAAAGGIRGAAGGGLLGIAGSLFSGGQKAASAAGNVIASVPQAASLVFQGAGSAASAGVSGGIGGTIANGAAGALLTLQSLGGLMSGDANRANAARSILSTGITDIQLNGAGWVGGRAGNIASAVANSRAGQFVGGVVSRAAPVAGRAASMMGGAASAVGEFAGAGMGVIGKTWGPFASGFASLAAGALPVVGAVSGIIAVVSLLGDHLESIRGIISNVFGESGLQVFDTFTGKLSEIGTFISGLFKDGGVANALAPVKEAITNMFGDDAGRAFGGLEQILQSVMGVVGQVVNFANTTVKPIISEIFSFIAGTVVPGVLQAFTAAAPYISGIISSLGSAIMDIAGIIGSAIQAALPFIESLISAIGSIAGVVIPAVLVGFQTFARGVSQVVSNIRSFLGGLIDFIKGVFTANWRQAWEGVKKIFGSAFDALKTLVKTPFNAVINTINKAVSGINSLRLKIPDWVPALGGKEFKLNIPKIPLLAMGGFTNGPSIAGEAGREAVISFQHAARDRNIGIWAEAGRMLGMEPQEIELPEFPSAGGASVYEQYAPQLTYSPNIVIQGNADKDVLERALKESEKQLEQWWEKKIRGQRRVAWG